MGEPRNPVAGFDDRRREEIARRWARLLSTTAYIPLSRRDLESALREVLDALLAALDGESEMDDIGSWVGKRLVGMHATGERCLSSSLGLLRDELVPGADSRSSALMALLTSVAAGYVSADRESTFQQQETLKRALLRSKLQADRNLAASEARFTEVFRSTPVGVAICQPDGTFLQANAALVRNLGYSRERLRTMRIHDFFHEEDAEQLGAVYGELVESGGSARLDDDRHRLVRANGELSWVYLALSVLAQDDGPQVVTIVEDVTDLHLLQKRFKDQALQDPLTGLSNRQHFTTQLQEQLANLPASAHVVVYHLALDSFDLINDGLGYESGDEVIKAVARRLSGLLAGEDAVVARFGGNEFGVFVVEGPDTAPVSEFPAIINRVLDDPIYLGDQGVAASANIGVVRRSVAEADHTDMLWAADVALRRAEATGKRQWALFDPDRASEERIRAKLAATMPGGLALGEIDVLYRPLLSLDSRELEAVEAELVWEPAEDGPVDHHECLRLAERSGANLSLRDWLLRAVTEQLGDWHAEGSPVQVVVSLSENQAVDPDLVRVVRGVLEADGVPSAALRLSVPTDALLGESRDEVRENFGHVGSCGVQTSVHGFRGTPEEFRILREFPVGVVRLGSEFVRVANEAESSGAPEVRLARRLVPLIREMGPRVWVGDLAAEQHAARWRDLGCDVGGGDLFGPAVLSFDVPELLERMRQAEPSRSEQG
ncbi:diguanylate cyclase domain-containing protein [Salinifilum ghardaiensis]